ncbi:MAG TPA: hypothetical protein VKB76_11285, partial [Ktedonobacterales bacterium]|nr:hypothetical protein [Ktedonobacterales bacterium]
MSKQRLIPSQPQQRKEQTMYKPNHTLGRWHYDFDKPGVYMRDPNDTEYNKPPICLAKTFPTAHGDGVPEARRNAKAMAAAPELLLLLRRAVAMHIEEFGEPDTSFAGWTRRRYWEPAQQQAKRAKLTPEEQVEFDAEIARRERGDEWVQEAKGLIKDLVGGWSGVGHRQYFS